jgi:GR25 family glycosyltransferase involved in LPS biosynthesis
MQVAPIALFVYNRLEHTRQTVVALQNNTFAEQSDLIIFSDASKSEIQDDSVRKVRDYIHQINGFKSVTIVERSDNFGLAKSIINGVTSVVNDYGRVIVLEDDMVTSHNFLQFMNDGLNVYEKTEAVASIHGYVYPIDDLPETFFLKGADCWGWATWKDRWSMFEPNGTKLLSELKRKGDSRRFDFNGAYLYSQMLEDQIAGKNNSWAVRWHASTFLKNKYTLYPGKSLVLNIGNDGSGTHCGETSVFSSELCNEVINVVPINVEDSQKALHAIENYFRKQKRGFLVRLMQLVAKIYGKLGK